MSRNRNLCGRILLRGLRKRCPRCGDGKLFAGWYTLRERCDECDLTFESSEGSTWAFMYVTTAAITGLIIVAMLMMGAGGFWVWRLLVFPLALVAITGTLPVRKGLAIACEYVLDIWFDRHESPPPQSPRNESHRAGPKHR